MHAYGANTGAGKYRGAYQMSKEFKNGMAWMIQKEMRDERRTEEASDTCGTCAEGDTC